MASQQDGKLAYDPKDTITGFNYEFCRNLFKNMQRLELEGKLYTPDGGDERVILSGLGAVCLNQLRKQLYGADEGYTSGMHMETEEIYELFSTAREFLKIMELEE